MARQPFHPDRLTAATAESQYGLINTTQVRAAGVGDDARLHRRRTGRYERALPKVDRLGGSSASWEQQVKAAVLWAGPGSAASHRSAAALWELDACPRAEIEITTPSRNLRSQEARHIILHQYQRLPDNEIVSVRGIETTIPARTLLDLAAVVRGDRLEKAMDSALRQKLVTLPELRLVLSLHAARGRRGVRAFRRALDLRDGTAPPPHRGLEAKLWRLISDSDLPVPLREYPVIQDSRELYRIDFAYPDQMLAIEADSWTYHSDRISWSNDHARGNVLTRLGWRVLHFTFDDVVTRPQYVLETIRSALGLLL